MWTLIGIWSRPHWQPRAPFFQCSVICFNYRRAGMRWGNNTVNPSVRGSTGPMEPSWYEAGDARGPGWPLAGRCQVLERVRGTFGWGASSIFFSDRRCFVLFWPEYYFFRFFMIQSVLSFRYGMIVFLFFFNDFYLAFLCSTIE